MCGLALRSLSSIQCLCVSLLHIYVIFLDNIAQKEQSELHKQKSEEFKHVGDSTNEVCQSSCICEWVSNMYV